MLGGLYSWFSCKCVFLKHTNTHIIHDDVAMISKQLPAISVVLYFKSKIVWQSDLGYVNPEMSCKFALSVVSFAALVALERLLSGVRSHVALQVRRWSECVVTLVTLVCLIMWSFRLPVEMLENLHVVHLWGFPPEWVLLCCFRLFDWIVVKSHWLHWCGFSPVCFWVCFLRFPRSFVE